MADRRQIGVRYCGGCNPRYDRVALVKRIGGFFHFFLKGQLLLRHIQPGGREFFLVKRDMDDCFFHNVSPQFIFM